jgi:hypothetical protein
MNFIGTKALLEMQSDPRKLIRGSRRPIFFPWRPVPRPEKSFGTSVFISTASDLNWWRKEDVLLLEELDAPLRLVRPGTLSEKELLALPPTVDAYMLDVWCCEESVRASLMEIFLPQMPTINEFVI